jgi:single-strand DNA-binding protein
MSVNKAILVGYLGGDLEIKTFTNGKLASFNLATSTHWKDRVTGEKKESVQWHKVKMNVKGDEGILP